MRRVVKRIAEQLAELNREFMVVPSPDHPFLYRNPDILVAHDGHLAALYAPIATEQADPDLLVKDVVTELNTRTIPTPTVTVTKATVSANLTHNTFEALQMSGAKSVVSLVGRYPLPNMLELIGELMQFTTPAMRITRRTILRILQEMSPRLQQGMVENPNDFAKVAVETIKRHLSKQLVDGIQYEETGEWWDLSVFGEDVQRWADRLLPAEKSVYESVEYESGVEHDFVKGLEGRADVLLYVKLPEKFTVPTPIGEYNPDWAVVVQPTDVTGRSVGGKRCYLVRETKGTTDPSRLQWEHERWKTACGKRHFEAIGVDYQIVDSAGDLRVPAACGGQMGAV